MNYAWRVKPALLRALTVQSPHGELIARGLKPVENRGWAPPAKMLGGYIAVHASRTWDLHGVEALYVPRGVPYPRLEECAFGIVAVAHLVGWVERHPSGVGKPTVRAMLPGHGLLDTDWPWWSGRFGWLLRDVVRIEPVPCRGQLGLWQLPDVVGDAVRRRYAARRPS